MENSIISSLAQTTTCCIGTYQRRYHLPPHIYVAATQDGVIFLDLKRDKYFGVSCETVHALASVVDGWQFHHMLPSFAADDNGRAEPVSAAEYLVSTGLLAKADAPGKPARSIRLHNERTMLPIDDQYFGDSPIGTRDVVAFLIAWLSAVASLRLFSIETVINRFRRRKCAHGGDAETVQVQQAAMLVRKFRRLRPFLFTAADHCLLHSLTLLNFLAYYDVFPMWVLGVKTPPFEAHSWVQHRHFVFDQTPEQVCFFTPILAV